MSVNTETRDAAQRTIFAARRPEVHHGSWPQKKERREIRAFPSDLAHSAMIRTALRK
jgi:hypothetical protein